MFPGGKACGHFKNAAWKFLLSCHTPVAQGVISRDEGSRLYVGPLNRTTLPVIPMPVCI